MISLCSQFIFVELRVDMDNDKELRQGCLEEQKKCEDNANEGNYMTFGMSIGMALGASMGHLLFDNMATGLAVGMCLGMAVGAVINKK